MIALKTTAAPVTPFTSAQNLDGMSRVISDAQAVLAAEPTGPAHGLHRVETPASATGLDHCSAWHRRRKRAF